MNLKRTFMYRLKTICLLAVAAVLLPACRSLQETVVASPEAEAGILPAALPEAMQRKYDYFFLEAVKRKEKGDYDAAFELYRRCLQINPNAASALYEIAQFYLYLKQPEKATACIRKATLAAPGNYWYKRTLAALYLSESKTDEAIRIYEDMSRQFPTRQEPLMALADLYNKKEDYPNVIRTLDRLETTQGKSEQISMNKFRIYILMKENKKAFEEIENLAKEYPNDMRYLALLGDVYLNNGKTEDAYKTYKKVLAEEPDNAMAMLSLASYYDKTGQDELYKQQVDTLLLKSNISTSVKAEIMKSVIMRSEQGSKDSTEVIAMFERIMRQPQPDAQLPMLYAQYLISKGMEEESVPVLRQITRIDPSNPVAYMQLLSYAVKDNDYPEIIRICEKAVEYVPETLEFHFYLGLAYMQEDRKDEALATFRNGTSMANEKSSKELVSDFYCIIGDLLHEKQLRNEAYAAYDSSLAYNPDNIGALNNYAYFLSVERKDLDKAEEMSYKTVKKEPDNATYLDTYAWILFEKGRYAEAKIYIDNAMKNDGGESDVIVEHCGDIYFMNGETEKALEYWLKAKELGSASKTLDQKIQQKKYIPEE